MFRIRNFDRLFNWHDFDRAFSMLGAFRQGEAESAPSGWSTSGRGRSQLNAGWEDTGSEYMFYADIPGLSDSGVRIFLNQDVLTIKGERQVASPEGFSVHRRERPALQFSRSYTLPQAVDAEKTTARVKDGVLTLTLPKLPESQPRQITVKTA